MRDYLHEAYMRVRLAGRVLLGRGVCCYLDITALTLPAHARGFIYHCNFAPAIVPDPYTDTPTDDISRHDTKQEQIDDLTLSGALPDAGIAHSVKDIIEADGLRLVVKQPHSPECSIRGTERELYVPILYSGSIIPNSAPVLLDSGGRKHHYGHKWYAVVCNDLACEFRAYLEAESIHNAVTVALTRRERGLR